MVQLISYFRPIIGLCLFAGLILVGFPKAVDRLTASGPSVTPTVVQNELEIDTMFQLNETCHSNCWWGLVVGESTPSEWQARLTALSDVQRVNPINEFENEYYFRGISPNSGNYFMLSLREQSGQVVKLHLSYSASIETPISLANEATYGDMRSVFSIIGMPKEM